MSDIEQTIGAAPELDQAIYNVDTLSQDERRVHDRRLAKRVVRQVAHLAGEDQAVAAGGDQRHQRMGRGARFTAAPSNRNALTQATFARRDLREAGWLTG
jgi:hypothetical protein